MFCFVCDAWDILLGEVCTSKELVKCDFERIRAACHGQRANALGVLGMEALSDVLRQWLVSRISLGPCLQVCDKVGLRSSEESFSLWSGGEIECILDVTGSEKEEAAGEERLVVEHFERRVPAFFALIEHLDIGSDAVLHRGVAAKIGLAGVFLQCRFDVFSKSDSECSTFTVDGTVDGFTHWS